MDCAGSTRQALGIKEFVLCFWPYLFPECRQVISLLFLFSFHSVKLVLYYLLCISKAQQCESWKERSQGKKEVRLTHSADL